MPLRPVVVTGVGAVSPYGHGVAPLLEGFFQNRPAVVNLADRWLDDIPDLTCHVGATLPEPVDPSPLPRKHRRTMGPVAVMAWAAAREAVNSAGLDEDLLHDPQTGIAFASTTGSTQVYTEAFRDYYEGNLLKAQGAALFFQIMGHTCAANVALALGLRGRAISPTAACASGAQAIGLAFEAIAHGAQERMIAGGADELHPLTVASFDLVQASSHRYNDRPDRTPRPFDRDRDGVVCGEGAGALLLESLESARRRGAPILAEVVAFHTSHDGAHMAHPQTDAVQRAVQSALDTAALLPETIGYVNAHATGTQAGDAAEAAALQTVFGKRTVPVTSLKGHIGHTLAASGALETIAAIEMMHRGRIVPTRNLEEPDPDCAGIRHVIGEPLEHPFDAFLKNSFALGGVNTVLILKRHNA